MKSSRFRSVWILSAVIWACLLLYLHFLPGSEINLDGWYLKYHMDKVAHVIMFTVFFILLYLSVNTGEKIKLKNILIPVLGVVIYGGVLELIQGTIVVDRTADGLDFISDILGVPTGFLILKLFNC